MAFTATNLCLHYLQTPGARRRRLALSADQLRAIVARERASGRGSSSLAEYARGNALGEDRFTLSFDDAHRSVLEIAAPVLDALGVRGTLFVPTAYVGTSDEFLDWDGLRALRDQGWVLGSHTVTHPRMSWKFHGETREQSAARLYDECARSRETMERELGIDVALFAYPYGECPPEARDAVARAGYRAAFTVADSFAWDGDSLCIPRADAMEAHGLIRASSATPTGISVVVPACDRVEILRAVVERLMAQSYPRERHELIIVDDGSREDLRALLPKGDPYVRFVPGGEVGVFGAGQARQRGIDAARFDTVAFLDADVVVGRDFLWHLDWVHQRVPGAVVLGYLSGYNLHDMGAIHTLADVRAAEDIERELPVIPDRSREPTLRGCLDNLDWLDEPWRLAYTGNLSVSRALLRAAGGFATEFKGWGLEDLDLGVRLHRAGANWVFSRFAMGFHLVDPAEGPPRNPFRKHQPVREDFSGYLRNLETLTRRHRDHAGVSAFREQTLRDIDETCGRPDTVGVEMGGSGSLAYPFYRALHRVQPGGVTVPEVLDRVAYAAKVGARALYILGGEPGEHPGLIPALDAARAAGIRRVTVQTHAVPFADPTLVRAAVTAGITGAAILTFAFDREVFEATTRTPGSYDRFIAGMDNLRAAGVALHAIAVVAHELLPTFAETLAELADRAIALDEVVVVDPTDLPAADAIVADWRRTSGARAPSLRPAAR